MGYRNGSKSRRNSRGDNPLKFLPHILGQSLGLRSSHLDGWPLAGRDVFCDGDGAASASEDGGASSGSQGLLRGERPDSADTVVPRLESKKRRFRSRRSRRLKPLCRTVRLFKPSLSRTFIPLAVGIFCGFSFAYILMVTSHYTVENLPWAISSKVQHSRDPHDHTDLDDVTLPEMVNIGSHSHDEEFHKDEDIVAKELAEKVRVLCWVMTSPSNHEKKARHVKATWGHRCNVLLFMSTSNDSSLPSIALPVKEGRDYLWAKTKEAFKYVYQHYLDKADWFMKADDDTYVIVENLRYMLSAYSHDDPLYFGCRFKPYVKQGYMSGGAGYVLSRKAVKLFIEDGVDSKKCREDHGGAEDVEIGKCLELVGVKAMDSRDSLGRGRFFPFVPEHHLIPNHVDKDFWYWKYIFYESKEGLDCCSDSAVSFHYVSPNLMYVLEYLIYHLRPYGISHKVELPLHQSSDATVGLVPAKPAEEQAPSTGDKLSRIKRVTNW